MLPLVSKAHLPRADVCFFVANFHTLKSLSFPLIFSVGYKNANSIILSAHTIFSKSPVVTITFQRQINCAYIFLEVQWPQFIQYFNLTIQNRAEGLTLPVLQIIPFIHANTHIPFFLTNAALLTLIL